MQKTNRLALLGRAVVKSGRGVLLTLGMWALICILAQAGSQWANRFASGETRQMLVILCGVGAWFSVITIAGFFSDVQREMDDSDRATGKTPQPSKLGKWSPLICVVLIVFALGFSVYQSQNTVVYVTDTGRRFHREGCESLEYSRHSLKRGEAHQEGYTACKICFPDPEEDDNPADGQYR
jgi:hypothetical protein